MWCYKMRAAAAESWEAATLSTILERVWRRKITLKDDGES